MVKGLSLVGHEKVPCGFDLRTGDGGSDTADGAGNHRKPASRAWIAGRNWKPNRVMDFYFFFLRNGIPDWLGLGKGEEEGLCVVLWVFKGL